MATIFGYLVAAAVAAVVMSLPFGKTKVGSVLRRIAAFCAILVLLPAIVVSIVTAPSSAGGPGTPDTPAVGCGAEALLALAFLSLVAWAFLFIRKWLVRGRDRQRTPMMRRYRHRADNDLLEFLDRFNNRDRDA
jgi:hypothetical protein